MKVTFYYDLDDNYQEGPEFIHVVRRGYPYTVEIPHKDMLTSIVDLYDANRLAALREIIYGYMSDLGEFESNVHDS